MHGILKNIVTWFTFALSSAERSEPSLFSSSVAVGSRPQTIGIFKKYIEETVLRVNECFLMPRTIRISDNNKSILVLHR